MNLYLDASALIKRYLKEPWSLQTTRLISRSVIAATAILSRADVSAGLAKATRMNRLSSDEARHELHQFRAHWPNYFQIDITNRLIGSADELAWKHGLRAYDAAQLASALIWQTALGEEVVFATFDIRLWNAAREHPLIPSPENLPALLEEWHS